MAAEDKAVQIAVPFCADDGEILLHQQGNWVEWDGGMIGGHPVYAPVDDSDDTFHRAVYVFLCLNKTCKASDRPSPLVLRAQLPKSNPFYAKSRSEAEELQDEEVQAVTTARAQFAAGRPSDGAGTLCEWMLEIDAEPSEAERKEAESAAARAQLKGLKIADDVSAGPDDEMSIADLTQEELVAMTGRASKVDAAMNKFRKRTRCEPQQCIRYDRDAVDTPLWVSASHQPTDTDVPACESCGAPRTFEFQIMPQAISFLLGYEDGKHDDVEEGNGAGGDGGERGEGVKRSVKQAALEGLDFGTIAVYTCSKSCKGPKRSVPGDEGEAGGAESLVSVAEVPLEGVLPGVDLGVWREPTGPYGYRREFAWVQHIAE